MKTIELTNGMKVLVDDEDYDFLMQWKWNPYKRKSDNTTYAARTLHENRKSVYVIRMHRVIMKIDDPNVVIDHMDHNGLNNQKSNLRVCAQKFNSKNTSSRTNSSSKYLGVGWDSKRGKWKAKMRSNGKEIFIGRFDSEIDAAKAYDEAAIKHHGEFANPNFK